MEEQKFVKFCLLFVLFLNAVTFSIAKFVITAEEKKALEQFRPLVKDIITQDYQTADGYLVLWLRAKKLNVRKAVQLFTETQRWRKKNNIDSILDEKFPEFERFERTFTSDGVDYEGRTVFTASIGNFDFRRLILAGKKDRIQRYSQQATEKAASLAAKRAHESNGTQPDSRVVSVSDLTGFSIRRFACLSCLSYFAASQKEVDTYYPGFVGLSVNINVPRVALPFMETVLNFAAEETRANIKIFGTDKAEWTKYLHTIIPPDQLRYQFGGTKVDK